MYYWSHHSNKTTLEKEMLTISGLKEIYIGTAFFSNEGLRILSEVIQKNNISKNKVYIYISDEFSQDKPHKLLEEMCKIAQVRIFFNHTFHSKVYLFKGQVNQVIYGSSNFTAGGLYKNIEFNSIEIVTGEKLDEIERFFKYCDFQSTEATGDVIKYYEDNQAEIDALKQMQKRLRKKIKGYIRQSDAMDSDDYDIDDYYFTFSDYETFFDRNSQRDDIDIREQRKSVQDKMLAIHERVYPHIKKLGLDRHWNKNHVTSVIRPCEYNKGRVTVRYGKTKKEVDVVNIWLGQNEKDEIKGFQKHGCLQFCIVPTGFEINLFLAVRHDAIDRAYVQENLNELKPKITKELAKLKGYGITWEIYNDVTEEYHCFEIDNEETEDFCKFLQKYDRDGCESYLKLFYQADDEALYDIDSISNEVINYMTRLIPLYNAMVWRPKV